MKALKTVDIKGKQYVEVKERLLALAEERDTNQIPYSIQTEYQYIDSRKMWIVKATLAWNGNTYTWLAQEIESDNYKEVNYTSALENCETSAVWRACAMAWIGIIDWVASADEVKKAINRGSQFKQEWPTEKHTCNKCWVVQDANVFEWSYWPCFKCSSCGKYSKPNKVEETNIDLNNVF